LLFGFRVIIIVIVGIVAVEIGITIVEFVSVVTFPFFEEVIDTST